MARDTFCSYCGVRFADITVYPRMCTACGAQTWANPIPVAVVLLPVIDGARSGLLAVRRAIPPAGKLALVGGFIEAHESWQTCAAREMREETGVVIDPASLETLWYSSSEPRPDRILLFALAPAIQASALPPFEPNAEVSQRGIWFGAGTTGGPDDQLAFSLHAEAARGYFERAGIVDSGFVVR
jgi:ADP-ribose pyrophosphatase YjhB (NUDIX family)